MTAATLDQTLREFVQHVDEEYASLTCDRGHAVIILDALRGCIKGLRDIEREVERDIVAALPADREFIVAGVGVVQVRRKSTRTRWDHDRLLPVVTALALDERRLNEDTGEYEPAWEAVARVLKECVGFSYWRKKALAPRGVDVDEFAHVERGDLGVWIQP